jgi:hypothetical protein
MYYGMNWHLIDLPKNKPVPKFITHSFVNINEIKEVSKYRSGVGHDASFDGETCRSMRHYFGFFDPEVQKAEDKVQYKHDTFAPVSGKVMGISGGKSNNGSWQVNIRPDNSEASGFEVRIDNIKPKKGLRLWSHVEAGEKIGESLGMAEITIAYHYLLKDHGFSYFDVMTDSLFADYQKAAGQPLTREDLKITKEYRDTHPLQCDNTDGRFFISSAETESDYNRIPFNGYMPSQKNKKKESNNIVDFESCAKEYPVLETYPEQCMTSDGKSFTKKY